MGGTSKQIWLENETTQAVEKKTDPWGASKTTSLNVLLQVLKQLWAVRFFARAAHLTFSLPKRQGLLQLFPEKIRYIFSLTGKSNANHHNLFPLGLVFFPIVLGFYLLQGFLSRHIHFEFNELYDVARFHTHINPSLVGAVFHNKRYAGR